jgi:hypothetical protein
VDIKDEEEEEEEEETEEGLVFPRETEGVMRYNILGTNTLEELENTLIAAAVKRRTRTLKFE